MRPRVKKLSTRIEYWHLTGEAMHHDARDAVLGTWGLNINYKGQYFIVSKDSTGQEFTLYKAGEFQETLDGSSKDCLGHYPSKEIVKLARAIRWTYENGYHAVKIKPWHRPGDHPQLLHSWKTGQVFEWGHNYFTGIKGATNEKHCETNRNP